MIENSSGFQKHVARNVEVLYDAELGVTVFVCTDDYICNVTGEEFWVMGSGRTEAEAIEDCSAPTNTESMNHIVREGNTFEIDFDRLRAAMETESYTMPHGLTREEKRAYIKACANGEVEANN